MIFVYKLIKISVLLNFYFHGCLIDSLTTTEEWINVLTEVHNSHIAIGHIPKNEPLKVNIEGMEFDLLNFQNYTKLPLVDSPFGKGTQTLVDKTVRNSREYTLTNRADNALIIMGQTIVNNVLGNNYCSIPYKIVIYEKDSFFSGHVDTPEKDLMYTLVLVLPSKYKGGGLVFGKWYNTNAKMIQNDEYINFVLFRINCPHRVEKVTDGYRASITYKVYKTAENSSLQVHQKNPFLENIILPELLEPNIVLAYPNVDQILGILNRSGIDYILAYGAVRDDIKEVYSELRSSEEEGCLRDRDYPNFEAVARGRPYTVDKVINIGFQKSFMELGGQTGNEGYIPEFQVHYITFILINPTNPGPLVSWSWTYPYKFD